MNTNDPAATPAGQQRDPTTAPGGASYRVRRSYGPSYAAPPRRAGKPGWSPSEGARRPAGQPAPGGAGHRGEADDPADREQPSPSTPAFPDRTPRRRSRNPSERARKTTTRLSDTEKAEITDAAAQRGVTVARFLATAGLSAARGRAAVHSNDQLDTAIDELAALRTALARIGNNINQIAFVLNSGGQPRAGELEHALGTLTGLLARVDDAANDLVTRRL
ncbi:plasmid mobilization relaxosome protein MobC [Streptomyces sanglieri]|uniref:Plasmid mobilization relaxosome protein MobC n=1 Tax=Streptomyces sanglieri TaxID=193460 RepID=A0ABW2WX14_9ACTN